MNRFLALAVLFGALLASPGMGQSCQPPGLVIIGPCCTYQFIANGAPSGSSCWTTTNVSVVTDTLCGWSGQAFDFTYGDSLSQTITVPEDVEEYTNWSLSYLLDFNDPNNDGWWNRLEARVTDAATGQIIASHVYWGSDPDLTCTRRSLLFTGNYAGRTLKVTFSGGSAYANTVIRVRGIALHAEN